MFRRNSKRTNDSIEPQNNEDENIQVSATDILKSYNVSTKAPEATVEVTDTVQTEATASNESETTDTVETVEDKTENKTIVNVVVNEVEMDKKVNVKDIMAKVMNFLNGQADIEDIQASELPVEQNGVEMTQEQKTELEKVQEELKLANEKAEAEATAKAEIEQQAKDLQEKINTMNAEKEAEKVKAEKAELSKLVETELSFVGGTVDENTDKLYELKSVLNEKSELFDFVVDSLKKKSTEIEASLDETGINPDKDKQELTVDQKVDQLVQDKLEKNPTMKEAVAYTQVLDENPELKSAVYGSIGKVEQSQEQDEE